MKTEKNRILLKKAKEVLNNNWTGSFTKPSPKLYPHQWSWDSGFIAIGYANYDIEKAKKELVSLFEGQWKNGMLPHIVFNKKAKGYFPGQDYWNSPISKDAPRNKLTSGITQPPTHAIAAYKIYKNSKKKADGKKFLKKIYPKILAFHRYLHIERDPEKSGLATITHPWESGFDNSPRWDKALARIKPKNLPKYKRSDLEHVGCAAERPTNEEYDRYIYLTELMKKNNYDTKRIYKKIPFRVKDVVFNSILHAGNNRMMEIGDIIGKDTTEIRKWQSSLEKGFFKYFCPSSHFTGFFYDYDVKGKEHIKTRSISSLIPLFAGILDKKQAEKICRLLSDAHFCGSGNCKYLIAPSIDVHAAYFKPITYWRGPAWINVNWMLYYGLKHYKHMKKAEEIKNAMINLIKKNGFYEYFDPNTGKGLGTDNFSWTAALLVDLLMEK